jgi:hypothetical protein
MADRGHMATEKEKLVQRGPHDVGGMHAGRIGMGEHELLPWEKRCHALCDVLAVSKLVTTDDTMIGVAVPRAPV